MFDCLCSSCDYADDECPFPVWHCPICGSATSVRRNSELLTIEEIRQTPVDFAVSLNPEDLARDRAQAKEK